MTKGSTINAASTGSTASTDPLDIYAILLPSLKLVRKTREGSKIKKDYEPPHAFRRLDCLSGAAVRAHVEWKKSGVKAVRAGEFVQVDTLHERSLERARFHFTAIDPVTRVVHGRLYASASSRNAKAFLLDLVRVWPFPVKSIQVDNGSEFMGEFEVACKSLGIRLFTIPPRSPKVNAMVERMQRTYRDEHYAFEGDCLTREEQQEALQDYNHYYNHGRIHSAIGDVPPMEYAEGRNFLSQLT